MRNFMGAAALALMATPAFADVQKPAALVVDGVPAVPDALFMEHAPQLRCHILAGPAVGLVHN